MKLRLRIHECSALLAFSCCFVFAQEPPESIPALMFEAAKDPTMLILLAAAIVSLVCGVVPGVCAPLVFAPCAATRDLRARVAP